MENLLLMKKLLESNRCIIECRKKYFRPAEVDTLIGDASKAKRILKSINTIFTH